MKREMKLWLAVLATVIAYSVAYFCFPSFWHFLEPALAGLGAFHLIVEPIVGPPEASKDV